MNEPWPRPDYRGGLRAARAATASFFAGAPPAGARIDPGHGAPADRIADLKIGAVERRRAPHAFDAWLARPRLADAERLLGMATARALSQAGGAVVCECVREEPSDLGHLQAQWAARGALGRVGALAHLDLVSGAWLPADLRPDHLRIELEITTHFSPEPVPEAGLPVHTRGFEKLGQPDLIAFTTSRSDAPFFHALLRAIAQVAATGSPIVAGSTFNDGHSARYRAEPLDQSRYARLPVLPDPTLRLRRVAMDPRA